nr:aldehyde dehydrogenase family protein [Albitalea sp.]
MHITLFVHTLETLAPSAIRANPSHNDSMHSAAARRLNEFLAQVRAKFIVCPAWLQQLDFASTLDLSRLRNDFIAQHDRNASQLTLWNFPIAIPAWKIAPALAFGNCVVFKPADLVPGSAWALAEIISRAGFPPGAFNLVMGRGSVVGQTFIDHVGVDAISFTGSADTGSRVIAAAAPRRAKLQLEMGGKNPLVVLDDADLAVAADCALQGSFHSTGQRCTASSRLIVHKRILAAFVDALRERMESLVVPFGGRKASSYGPREQGRHAAEFFTTVKTAYTAP